ncbi:MAG: hypothetical protein DCC55_22475 [Chloroflexi bacterium]|nr:MAG: hypothetical protein DCC55_22475 [Chloroflexota bacterium]
MTTRTEIRARAYTEAARLEADARRYEASQETIRAGIMAATIPWIALIIMGGIVAAIVVWWQGKIWHTRTTMLLAQQPRPQLPRPRQPGLADLMLLAQQQGYQIEIEDQTAYLLDASGRRVGQRSLTDKGTNS